MNSTIEVGTFTQTLFALLEETFTKTQGIYLDSDTSLAQTLAGLSAEQASRALVPGGTTIAAHVFHTRFYLDVLDRYMQHAELGSIDWAGSWKQRAVTAAEWDSLRADLQAACRRVLEQVKAYDDWNDEKRLGGAVAIVAHTAYHLGAIRQILTAVR